jgi:hypothetical protein
MLAKSNLPSAPIQKTIQLRARELPRVAFVRDEALQDGEVSMLAPVKTVVDPARHRWNVRKERMRGQEPPNLEVGIQAAFNAPKRFEYEAVTVHDGAVALFDLQHAGFERRVGTITPHLMKRLGRSRQKLAG